MSAFFRLFYALKSIVCVRVCSSAIVPTFVVIIDTAFNVMNIQYVYGVRNIELKQL